MEPQNARGRRESGQMLILFVLALGVLMGMVAMTIDVGLILHERRSQQNAADAAALAAVADLPDSPSAAVAAVYDWANRNGYSSANGATVTVNTPYNGNSAAVEVVIEVEVPFIFGRALGLDSVDVSARGVASREPGSEYEPAFFAAATGCNNPIEVSMTASNIEVVGDIVSNGSAKIIGSDVNVDGTLTFICDDPLLNNGSFTDGLNQVTDLIPWPGYFVYADFACDFQHSEADQPWLINPTSTPSLYDDPASGALKPGVYCHNADIQVSQGATGTVTFVSKSGVTFAGGPYDLKPYQHNVVIFSEYKSVGGTSAIHISANGFTWEGIIFARKGEIKFSASTVNSSSGAVWGETVQLSSSSGNITAIIDSEPSLGPPKLVE